MIRALAFNRNVYICLLVAIFIWFVLELRPRDITSAEEDVSVALVLCEPMESESKEYIRKELHLNKFLRQYNQVITLIKSLVITWRHAELGPKQHFGSKRGSRLNVIIFSNNQSRSEEIRNTILSWSPEYTNFLNVSFREPLYPSGLEWLKNIYAPCATLRLLLPTLLPEICQVIYMDTDFIFFRDIRSLWSAFRGFSHETFVAGDGHFWTPNQDGLATLDPILRLPTDLPHHSVRTGIMALNLQKFRESNWMQYVISMKKYITRLLLYPDGVILNSFLTFHENSQLNFSCTWNFKEMHFSREEGKTCSGKGISSMQGVKGDFIKNGTYSQKFYQEFENIELTRNFSATTSIKRVEQVFNVPETCSKSNSLNCNSKRYSRQVVLHYLRKLV